MSYIEDKHRDYKKHILTESNISRNPIHQFADWFEEAGKAGILDPNAMILSTAGKDLIPSSRVVLLKQFDEKGFVFFTNYESRKGIEINENPNAALLFFWDVLERQIRIKGKIEKATRTESEDYFNTRPYSSRIGAIASKQSKALKSRFTLMREVAKLIFKYPKHVPLPDNWGGYRLIPDMFEFWQGRESRLHDRFRYDLDYSGWNISRLYP